MRLKLSQSLGNFASEKPSPEGEGYIFALFLGFPLGGKLSTKLTDEGQLQYRVNSFLQKTSCPPHHLASQGASPAGEAYIFALFLDFPLGGSLYFCLISWLPPQGKPIFAAERIAAYFLYILPYFRKVFKNSLSSADTLYESRHFEIALFIVNLFKCGAHVRYANVFSRKCVKHSAISHAFAIFT